METEGGGGDRNMTTQLAATVSALALEERANSEAAAPPCCCGGADEEGSGARITTKHPNTDGGEEVDSDDLSFTLDKETMDLYAAIGDGADITRNLGKTTLATRTAADGKRKKLVRFDKEYVEMMISMPPTPVPWRTPNEHLDMMDAPARLARIAKDDKRVASFQKEIEMEAEMRRQYPITGYADIELTDGEEEEHMDWRPWVYLEAVGLAD